jgi:hypothetical protein
LVISLDKVTGEALCRKTGIPESGRGPNRLHVQFSRYRQHNHDHCHIVLVSRLIPALFGRFVIAANSHAIRRFSHVHVGYELSQHAAIRARSELFVQAIIPSIQRQGIV